MRKQRDSNSGDSWGLLIFFVVVVILVAAFLSVLRQGDSVIGPVEPLVTVVIQNPSGMRPCILIGFEEETGYILWRKNVPMSRGEFTGSISIEPAELVAGLGYTDDGEAGVSFFRFEGDCLVSTDRAIEGNILSAVNHFLSQE